MNDFFNFLFHLDGWLQQIMDYYPVITFLLIFSIVFTESAFFPAAPFLPGDGLLFSIGVLAAGNSIHLYLIIPVLILGGAAGTRTAFLIGRKTGKYFFRKNSTSNEKHIRQAHEFYERHGNMAFLLSRFMPVIRAIVPLVAGIAKMDNTQFWRNTFLSVGLWVVLITLVGYELGQLPFIKHYFGLIILGISGISLVSITIIAVRQQVISKKMSNAVNNIKQQ